MSRVETENRSISRESQSGLRIVKFRQRLFLPAYCLFTNDRGRL